MRDKLRMWSLLDMSCRNLTNSQAVLPAASYQECQKVCQGPIKNEKALVSMCPSNPQMSAEVDVNALAAHACLCVRITKAQKLLLKS